jgi:hypothetical protein
VRLKVEALYPPPEVEPFTDLFFGRIQRWRAEQAAARQARPPAAAGAQPA